VTFNPSLPLARLTVGLGDSRRSTTGAAAGGSADAGTLRPVRPVAPLYRRDRSPARVRAFPGRPARVRPLRAATRAGRVSLVDRGYWQFSAIMYLRWTPAHGGLRRDRAQPPAGTLAKRADSLRHPVENRRSPPFISDRAC
jgi:hypothetical protein